MSGNLFLYDFKQLNWKLWTVASLISLSAAGASNFKSIETRVLNRFESLSAAGLEAEKSGNYKEARNKFDLALLEARRKNSSKELIEALLNCARIDREFEEFDLAGKLAQEALELSQKAGSKDNSAKLAAMLALADTLESPLESLRLYKKAAALTEKSNSSQTKAALLLETAACRLQTQEESQALSAIKGAMRLLECCRAENSDRYADALLLYTSAADLSEARRLALAKEALKIKENIWGKEHPQIVSCLQAVSAYETCPEIKLSLMHQAKEIDQKVFGKQSLQYARDLCLCAELYESGGKDTDAKQARFQAARIFQSSKQNISALSQEFLLAYETLLRQLKFVADADRISAIIKSKDFPLRLAEKEAEQKADRDNDPEYWRRIELVPIENVEGLKNSFYDHVQIWYEQGKLRLDAFKDGKLLWQKYFGACPGGIVNAQADSNSILVCWKDGSGPIWHNDRYQLAQKELRLIDSEIIDAYGQQIEEQVQAVLMGDEEAIEYGAVETVPAYYINNNFIQDAISRGERKALQLYGLGDPQAAAQRLASVFDLTTKAINNKRSSLDQSLSRLDSWLDALSYQEQPIGDYICALNDYGFFLQQSGCIKESVPVLEAVARLSPGRAVVQLNLADSLWQQGQKAQARNSYQKYLSLMNMSRQSGNVPGRVRQRITEQGLKPAALRTLPGGYKVL